LKRCWRFLDLMADGFDPALFTALYAAEDRHFWFGARNLALKTVIESVRARLPRHYRVLEIGCGTGNTLRMLQDACRDAGIVVGMDLFGEGLRYARRRTSIPLVQGRVEQQPFATPFDLVGMFDVLEHIQDDLTTLQQVRALINPGGYLLITVPAGKALWSRFDEEAHHCRRYEREELRRRLVEAGLVVEYLTPFMTTLYPLARAARWWSAQANRMRGWLNRPVKSVVETDITIRPGLNGLMSTLLKLELPALRGRRQMPFGTSLLALARVP
jgi:SAM-dependent methyltransferase